MVSPTALFDRNAKEYLVPPMAELGFDFSSKERTFSRNRPPFQQVLYFRFLRGCRENYCEIDPRIQIKSDEYERWYRETWGEKPKEHYPDILLSKPAYWIDTWPKEGNFLTRHLPWKIRRGGDIKRFYLTNSARDHREMKELREAMLGPLMEKFDEVTSWDRLAECSTDAIGSFVLASDYFLIGGNRAMALKVLEDGLGEEDQLLREGLGDIVEELRLRYEKYSGENGLFLPIDPKDGTAE